MKKTLKTSTEGRKCKFPNCEQILSIYNHQAYCRVHWPQDPQEGQPKTYRHPSK